MWQARRCLQTIDRKPIVAGFQLLSDDDHAGIDDKYDYNALYGDSCDDSGDDDPFVMQLLHDADPQQGSGSALSHVDGVSIQS